MAAVFDMISFPLKTYLTQTLQYYLSKYIKGIHLEDFGVFGRDLVFNDLEIRKHVLQSSLDIPSSFDFSRGFIREMRIHIPWTNLLTQPIEVKLYTIELILKHNKDVKQNKYEAKTPLSPGVTTRRRLSSENIYIPDSIPKPGWLESQIRKILTNMTVQINNLVLKYQTNNTGLSLTLGCLSIYSTDRETNSEKPLNSTGKESKMNSKVIEGKDISLYLDRYACETNRKDEPLHDEEERRRTISGYELPIFSRLHIVSSLSFNEETFIDQSYSCTPPQNIPSIFTLPKQIDAPGKSHNLVLDIQIRKMHMSLSHNQILMIAELVHTESEILEKNISKEKLSTNEPDYFIKKNEIIGNDAETDNTSWLRWTIFPFSDGKQSIESKDPLMKDLLQESNDFINRSQHSDTTFNSESYEAENRRLNFKLSIDECSLDLHNMSDTKNNLDTDENNGNVGFEEEICELVPVANIGMVKVFSKKKKKYINESLRCAFPVLASITLIDFTINMCYTNFSSEKTTDIFSSLNSLTIRDPIGFMKPEGNRDRIFIGTKTKRRLTDNFPTRYGEGNNTTNFSVNGNIEDLIEIYFKKHGIQTFDSISNQVKDRIHQNISKTAHSEDSSRYEKIEYLLRRYFGNPKSKPCMLKEEDAAPCNMFRKHSSAIKLRITCSYSNIDDSNSLECKELRCVYVDSSVSNIYCHFNANFFNSILHFFLPIYQTNTNELKLRDDCKEDICEKKSFFDTIVAAEVNMVVTVSKISVVFPLVNSNSMTIRLMPLSMEINVGNINSNEQKSIESIVSFEILQFLDEKNQKIFFESNNFVIDLIAVVNNNYNRETSNIKMIQRISKLTGCFIFNRIDVELSPSIISSMFSFKSSNHIHLVSSLTRCGVYLDSINVHTSQQLKLDLFVCDIDAGVVSANKKLQLFQGLAVNSENLFKIMFLINNLMVMVSSDANIIDTKHENGFLLLEISSSAYMFSYPLFSKVLKECPLFYFLGGMNDMNPLRSHYDDKQNIVKNLSGSSGKSSSCKNYCCWRDKLQKLCKIELNIQIQSGEVFLTRQLLLMTPKIVVTSSNNKENQNILNSEDGYNVNKATYHYFTTFHYSIGRCGLFHKGNYNFNKEFIISVENMIGQLEICKIPSIVLLSLFCDKCRSVRKLETGMQLKGDMTINRISISFCDYTVYLLKTLPQKQKKEDPTAKRKTKISFDTILELKLSIEGINIDLNTSFNTLQILYKSEVSGIVIVSRLKYTENIIYVAAVQTTVSNATIKSYSHTTNVSSNNRLLLPKKALLAILFYLNPTEVIVFHTAIFFNDINNGNKPLNDPLHDLRLFGQIVDKLSINIDKSTNVIMKPKYEAEIFTFSGRVCSESFYHDDANNLEFSPQLSLVAHYENNLKKKLNETTDFFICTIASFDISPQEDFLKTIVHFAEIIVSSMYNADKKKNSSTVSDTHPSKANNALDKFSNKVYFIMDTFRIFLVVTGNADNKHNSSGNYRSFMLKVDALHFINDDKEPNTLEATLRQMAIKEPINRLLAAVFTTRKAKMHPMVRINGSANILLLKKIRLDYIEWLAKSNNKSGSSADIRLSYLVHTNINKKFLLEIHRYQDIISPFTVYLSYQNCEYTNPCMKTYVTKLDVHIRNKDIMEYVLDRIFFFMQFSNNLSLRRDKEYIKKKSYGKCVKRNSITIEKIEVYVLYYFFIKVSRIYYNDKIDKKFNHSGGLFSIDNLVASCRSPKNELGDYKEFLIFGPNLDPSTWLNRDDEDTSNKLFQIDWTYLDLNNDTTEISFISKVTPFQFHLTVELISFFQEIFCVLNKYKRYACEGKTPLSDMQIRVVNNPVIQVKRKFKLFLSQLFLTISCKPNDNSNKEISDHTSEYTRAGLLVMVDDILIGFDNTDMNIRDRNNIQKEEIFLSTPMFVCNVNDLSVMLDTTFPVVSIWNSGSSSIINPNGNIRSTWEAQKTYKNNYDNALLRKVSINIDGRYDQYWCIYKKSEQVISAEKLIQSMYISIDIIDELNIIVDKKKIIDASNIIFILREEIKNLKIHECLYHECYGYEIDKTIDESYKRTEDSKEKVEGKIFNETLNSNKLVSFSKTPIFLPNYKYSDLAEQHLYTRSNMDQHTSINQVSILLNSNWALDDGCDCSWMAIHWKYVIPRQLKNIIIHPILIGKKDEILGPNWPIKKTDNGNEDPCDVLCEIYYYNVTEKKSCYIDSFFIPILNESNKWDIAKSDLFIEAFENWVMNENNPDQIKNSYSTSQKRTIQFFQDIWSTEYEIRFRVPNRGFELTESLRYLLGSTVHITTCYALNCWPKSIFDIAVSDINISFFKYTHPDTFKESNESNKYLIDKVMDGYANISLLINNFKLYSSMYDSGSIHAMMSAESRLMIHDFCTLQEAMLAALNCNIKYCNQIKTLTNRLDSNTCYSSYLVINIEDDLLCNITNHNLLLLLDYLNHLNTKQKKCINNRILVTNLTGATICFRQNKTKENVKLETRSNIFYSWKLENDFYLSFCAESSCSQIMQWSECLYVYDEGESMIHIPGVGVIVVCVTYLLSENKKNRIVSYPTIILKPSIILHNNLTFDFAVKFVIDPTTDRTMIVPLASCNTTISSKSALCKKCNSINDVLKLEQVKCTKCMDDCVFFNLQQENDIELFLKPSGLSWRQDINNTWSKKISIERSLLNVENRDNFDCKSDSKILIEFCDEGSYSKFFSWLHIVPIALTNKYIKSTRYRFIIDVYPCVDILNNLPYPIEYRFTTERNYLEPYNIDTTKRISTLYPKQNIGLFIDPRQNIYFSLSCRGQRIIKDLYIPSKILLDNAGFSDLASINDEVSRNGADMPIKIHFSKSYVHLAAKIYLESLDIYNFTKRNIFVNDSNHLVESCGQIRLHPNDGCQMKDRDASLLIGIEKSRKNQVDNGWSDIIWCPKKVYVSSSRTILLLVPDIYLGHFYQLIINFSRSKQEDDATWIVKIYPRMKIYNACEFPLYISQQDHIKRLIEPKETFENVKLRIFDTSLSSNSVNSQPELSNGENITIPKEVTKQKNKAKDTYHTNDVEDDKHLGIASSFNLCTDSSPTSWGDQYQIPFIDKKININDPIITDLEDTTVEIHDDLAIIRSNEDSDILKTRLYVNYSKEKNNQMLTLIIKKESHIVNILAFIDTQPEIIMKSYLKYDVTIMPEGNNERQIDLKSNQSLVYDHKMETGETEEIVTKRENEIFKKGDASINSIFSYIESINKFGDIRFQISTKLHIQQQTPIWSNLIKIISGIQFITLDSSVGQSNSNSLSRQEIAIKQKELSVNEIENYIILVHMYQIAGTWIVTFEEPSNNIDNKNIEYDGAYAVAPLKENEITDCYKIIIENFCISFYDGDYHKNTVDRFTEKFSFIIKNMELCYLWTNTLVLNSQDKIEDREKKLIHVNNYIVYTIKFISLEINHYVEKCDYPTLLLIYNNKILKKNNLTNILSLDIVFINDIKVLLTNVMKEEKERDNTIRLVISCGRKNSFFLPYFDSIEISLQPISIQLDGLLITEAESYFLPFFMQINNYLQDHNNNVNMPYKLFNQKHPKTYINTLNIDTIDITISLENLTHHDKNNISVDKWSKNKTLNIFYNGLLASGMEDVIFSFDKIFTRHILNYFDQIIKDVLASYIADIVLRSPLLIGSLGITGNPVGFIRHIRQGVSDLFIIPFYGNNEKNGNILYNVALGSLSFFSHLFRGTLSSINGFSTFLSHTADYYNVNNQEKDHKRSLALSFIIQSIGTTANLINKTTKSLLSSSNKQNIRQPKKKTLQLINIRHNNIKNRKIYYLLKILNEHMIFSNGKCIHTFSLMDIKWIEFKLFITKYIDIKRQDILENIKDQNDIYVTLFIGSFFLSIIGNINQNNNQMKQEEILLEFIPLNIINDIYNEENNTILIFQIINDENQIKYYKFDMITYNNKRIFMEIIKNNKKNRF